jgi:hypothetical protein
LILYTSLAVPLAYGPISVEPYTIEWVALWAHFFRGAPLPMPNPLALCAEPLVDGAVFAISHAV